MFSFSRHRRTEISWLWRDHFLFTLNWRDERVVTMHRRDLMFLVWRLSWCVSRYHCTRVVQSLFYLSRATNVLTINANVDTERRSSTKMKNLFVFSLLLLASRVPVNDCLRCATDCPFVFTSFNIISFDRICLRYAERDAAQCTLVVELDFEFTDGGGVLMLEDRVGDDSLEIENKFGIDSNATSAVIRYRCSMSDNCAWEFFRELFGPALVNFDGMALRRRLSEQLYTDTPDPNGVQCAQTKCASNEYCQGHLRGEQSVNRSTFYPENNLPCVKASDKQEMISIERTFSYFYNLRSTMSLLCNRPECNSNTTLMLAYQIFAEGFDLPINYSFTRKPTSATTMATASALGTAVSLLFYLCTSRVTSSWGREEIFTLLFSKQW